MNIHFPLRLVRKGPGYYLTDTTGRTVAAMTADKADAEFILGACNAHHGLLEACNAVKQYGFKGQTPDGQWPYDMVCDAIAKATTQAMS